MLNLPTSQITKERIADWIEIFLLFDGNRRSLSLAEVSDLLSEEATIPDLDTYDRMPLDPQMLVESESQIHKALRSLATEGLDKETLLAQDAFAELEYRMRVVGANYPLQISASVALRSGSSWSDTPIYAFLAALNGRSLWRVAADVHKGARLFERLIVPTLTRYWGGDAAHFGWPRDVSEDSAFRAALPGLARRMGELLNVNPSELGFAHKDLEVDVVAWRAIDDRKGQTVMLCQCSIGDDWDTKGVHIRQWEKIINFAVQPVPGLAFPFIAEALRNYTESDWLLLCGKVGVPFDRLRIAKLTNPEDVGSELLQGIIDWVGSLVPKLTEAIQ